MLIAATVVAFGTFGSVILYRLKLDMAKEREFRAKLSGLALNERLVSSR